MDKSRDQATHFAQGVQGPTHRSAGYMGPQNESCWTHTQGRWTGNVTNDRSCAHLAGQGRAAANNITRHTYKRQHPAPRLHAWLAILTLSSCLLPPPDLPPPPLVFGYNCYLQTLRSGFPLVSFLLLPFPNLRRSRRVSFSSVPVCSSVQTNILSR